MVLETNINLMLTLNLCQVKEAGRRSEQEAELRRKVEQERTELRKKLEDETNRKDIF